MKKSLEPIINHISYFLDFCKEKGLSINTQKNYKLFLNNFIFWLKKENKQNLFPHKLNLNDILAYRLYLTQFRAKNGSFLKPATQNYYLIALRALLSYFEAKNIVSLHPNKIELAKGFKTEKQPNFLNKKQIIRLLLAPDTKTIIGLRDKAILETLIYSGFKVNQLVNLNKNQLEENNDLLQKAKKTIRKYLKARKDENNALFINFRSHKRADARLTIRSVEKIVNGYGRKINLPFLITPEALRWARPRALLNEEVRIEEIKNHKTFVIDSYSNKTLNKQKNKDKKTKNHFPAWHVIENHINKEIIWLKKNIPILPEKYKGNSPILKCDDCILRKIAILITSGKIEATQFKNDEDKDLWNNLTKKQNFQKISRHGKDWHKKMMDVIYEYFKLKNYEIILEPNLNYGRADLGVYLEYKKPIYIEIGTVSLFKLWYNFSTMKKTTFLVVSSENNLIEFNI